MTQILGYARASIGDQDVTGQITGQISGQTRRLEEGGASKVFTDVLSAKTMDRPRFGGSAGPCPSPGDTLAVVRLDRLARSRAELLTTVTMLRVTVFNRLEGRHRPRHRSQNTDGSPSRAAWRRTSVFQNNHRIDAAGADEVVNAFVQNRQGH